MFTKLLTVEDILVVGGYESSAEIFAEINKGFWPTPYQLNEVNGAETHEMDFGWPEYEVRLILNAKAAGFQKTERRKLKKLIRKCRSAVGGAK